MSESQDERTTDGPSDSAADGNDGLPDDLVPGDDNPLAEPLPDGESAGDLLNEGKPADEADTEAELDTSQEP